ncbi:hypothetical protein DDE83_001157 [Stemphylium lycopersici]|uniref:F-box domain-containing protein n=1 Tax=Stemphylium lycopersici TaxID=183478 RepID=A0A364NE17_STELY|nr:hypothetical protein DDE83_001157 [Stemphylium lycopersici]
MAKANGTESKVSINSRRALQRQGSRLLINKQLTLPGGTYRRDRATEVPASKHAALASSTCRIRPSEVQTRIGQTPAAAVPHGPCTNVFAAVVKEMGLKLDLCPFCNAQHLLVVWRDCYNHKLNLTMKMSDTAEPAHVPLPKTHTVINTARSETGCLSSKKPGQDVESLEQKLKVIEGRLKQVQQELENIRDATKRSTTPNTTQAQPLNKSTVGNGHLCNIPNELLLLVAEFLDYADMRNLKDTCKFLSNTFRPGWEKLDQGLDKFGNGLTKSTFPPTDSCTPRTDLTPTTGYAKDDLLELPSWAKRIFWKKARLKENIRNVLVENAKGQVHRDDRPTWLEWLEQDKWRKEFASEAFTRLSPQVQLFFVELIKGTWRDHSATAKEQFIDYNIEQERVRQPGYWILQELQLSNFTEWHPSLISIPFNWLMDLESHVGAKAIPPRRDLRGRNHPSPYNVCTGLASIFSTHSRAAQMYFASFAVQRIRRVNGASVAVLALIAFAQEIDFGRTSTPV